MLLLILIFKVEYNLIFGEIELLGCYYILKLEDLRLEIRMS